MLGFLPTLPELLARLIIMLLVIPVHEWAHAWAAYRLGDDTASLQGRLTLNPIAHLDPIGSLLLLFSGFGWGKPVPVSPYRLRGNMRASWALVSVAGPFSNLILAMLAAIPFRLRWLNLYTSDSSVIGLPNILLQFILINLSLMLFNLIPFPPLDGSRILAWLLPKKWAVVMDQVERFGGIGLILILLVLSSLGIFSRIIYPAMLFIARALFYY